jgi:hypothetical protein
MKAGVVMDGSLRIVITMTTPPKQVRPIYSHGYQAIVPK